MTVPSEPRGFLVPRSRDPQKAPLDPVGAVLSAVGIASLGACLAATAAVVVLRYLPHIASHETAVEAAEHMAELGVGGTPPAFVDDAPAR